MSDNQPRPWPIYAVSGILVILLLVFGSFFLVWCGTLFFLFQIDNAVGLAALIFPGLIAWLAFGALQRTWRGDQEAPRAALGALFTTLLFLVFVYVYSWAAGDMQAWFEQLDAGALLLLAAPVLLLLAAMGLVWRTRAAFQGHWIEAADSIVIEDAYGADNDDDWMHLGGA